MKRRDHDVTPHPAPDARPRSLHRRLTVALASAADRARLAQVLAGDLSSVGTPGGSPLIRSEDLWMAADGFAHEVAFFVQNDERRQLVNAKFGGNVAVRVTQDGDVDAVFTGENA